MNPRALLVQTIMMMKEHKLIGIRGDRGDLEMFKSLWFHIGRTEYGEISSRMVADYPLGNYCDVVISRLTWESVMVSLL